jgi:hypothetical protein
MRGGAILILLAICATGCGVSPLDPDPPTAAEKSEKEDAGSSKGRAQLWQQNCVRCHNARPATWYSEREWEVAMHHMHVRGYLTGKETRAISEFFRAAR